MELPDNAQAKTRKAGVAIKVLGVLGVVLTGGPILLLVGAVALGRMNRELGEGVLIILRTSVLWGLLGWALRIGAGYKGTDRLWAAFALPGVVQSLNFLLFVLGVTK